MKASEGLYRAAEAVRNREKKLDRFGRRMKKCRKTAVKAFWKHMPKSVRRIRRTGKVVNPLYKNRKRLGKALAAVGAAAEKRL